ncbi:hypothetical protein ACNUDN_31990 (plasmid) [Mycobacterium sp. smrl_JER01]|uniref:hypothetical protein n=1 Tax=Mycobacterium sp. smrl_JER01 TaxID=3402633 RepID=UPI003AD5363A
MGDYGHMSLKGLVISMASSNARKQAARDYQRQFPGTPYPVALRAVSHSQNSLQVVIGVAAGRPHWLNIEEAAYGGEGPHMAVVGSSTVGRSRVIDLMTKSLAERPPHRGVEVLATVRGGIGGISSLIDERISFLKHCGVRDFAELHRKNSAGDRRDLGDDGRAVVVIVDGDDVRDGLSPVEERETAATRPADEEAVTALNRLLRQGRSLDIHTVLNVRQIEADPWLATAAGCISSIVEVDDRGMSATSRSVTVPRTPIDVVLAVNSEGSEL